MAVRTHSAPLVDPRPFVLGPDDGPPVLLLHGLTGTPWEVRPLGEALAAEGYLARAPLLAGHASLAELEASTWRDWFATAEQAFVELSRGPQGPRPVTVVGFSMGALLALRLAALRRDRMASLVVMGVPLTLERWQRAAIDALARLRGTRLLHRVVGHLPKPWGVDISLEQAREHHPALPAFPYASLVEFDALQADVRRRLPDVRAPLLIVHGAHDHTAPVANSERLARQVGAAQLRRVVLPRSFHHVALDCEAARTREEVVSHVRAHHPRRPS